MRRHAKASTAESTQRQATRLGRIFRGALAGRGVPGDANGSGAPSRAVASGDFQSRSALAVALLAIAYLSAILASAAPAFAATVTDRPLLFTFNGSDTTAGAFGGSEMRAVAVDESSGSVYVIDTGHDVIDKFDANGVAQSFSATGTSSLDGSATPQPDVLFGRIAVADYGPNQGRIYALGFSPSQGVGVVDAFSPSGSFLWQRQVSAFALAIDTEGHLWVSDPNASQIREFAAAGSPPAEIGSFSEPEFIGALDMHTAADVYGARRYTSQVVKIVNGTVSSTLDSSSELSFGSSIAVDQSSPGGHIFTLHESDFNEYDSAGALVGTFGAPSIAAGESIGYYPSLDRVYVGMFGAGRVSAFGPVATGTVPDATIEATTAIGVSKATFNGKVNPQSVPNSYFFQWKEGTDSSWAGAKTSAPQTLPEDSVDHVVSFDADHLSGNRTYQVRLVTENAEKGLRQVSSADTFQTAQAAVAPALTISQPSAVTTTTAQVAGTVNPEEDFGTTWQVEISTDPACASGFASQPSHKLESEANSPVAVSEELTGLLPAEDYCVRISATNSFDETTSETKQFTTEAVLPNQVLTAFAAPRTDTTARINGRVNPEGAPLTYRFEYSENGGATWIALPVREDTSEAREAIVVSDELTGLTPHTEYSYRFQVENVVGEASPQGEAKTFTTRTSAEMTIPPDAFGEPEKRGIELVNNPDDGNQNVHMERPSVGFGGRGTISTDGEKAIWEINGGAPGGPNAAGNPFLATRTSSGWQSRAIAPPAEQQFGGGALSPQLLGRTPPDFSHFIATYQEVGAESALVRFGQNRTEQVLRLFPHGRIANESIDLTDDGSHVLLINEETGQIEDDGSGTPEVVSVMPDGTESECGATEVEGSFNGNSGGIVGAARYWRYGYSLISTADASRAYFQVKPNGSGCGSEVPLGLYERNRETAVTTLIDAGAAPAEPHLVRATPDGRKAYFVTKSQLDPADTNSDEDIYLWEEEAGESRCLTCEATADARVSGSKFGVMVSDDFSHIYFESEKALAAGGVAGGGNIYAMSGGAIRFVANISGSGGVDRDAELSANGNVFVFNAVVRSNLTSDAFIHEADGRTQCIAPGLHGEETVVECTRSYLYDDHEGSLECLNCDHGGISSHSSPFDAFKLSADGSTVVFSTAEALVTRDVNRSSDVYEWRNGAVRLITDGATALPLLSLVGPHPVAVDGDGSDAFFTVGLPLTGFEQSGLANAYDARIAGGFTPPSPPAHCSEESCQGPLQAGPSPDQPISSSFNGRGNVASPQRQRCRRGKVRRHGRCVSRHPHKRGHRRARGANQGRAK